MCLAAASLDEKDRGYGEELACIAAAALLRAGQLELAAARPRQACKRLLQVGGGVAWLLWVVLITLVGLGTLIARCASAF